jgi:hypothetical protein
MPGCSGRYQASSQSPFFNRWGWTQLALGVALLWLVFRLPTRCERGAAHAGDCGGVAFVVAPERCGWAARSFRASLAGIPSRSILELHCLPCWICSNVCSEF